MYRRSDKQLLRTKIIATVGPEDTDIFGPNGNETRGVKYEQLFDWYRQPDYTDYFIVDVLRLNMAFHELYGQQQGHQDMYQRIFDWAEQERNRLARNIAILGDLPGGKTRLGPIERKNLKIERNASFELHLKDRILGNTEKASVLVYGEPLARVGIDQYTHIMTKLRQALHLPSQGIIVSVADGAVVLRAHNEAKDGIIACTVEQEGEISDGQGVTFERIDLDLPSFADPDKEVLSFLLDKGGDFLSYIAISFVRTAEDVLQVRKFIEDWFINQKGYSRNQARSCCPDIIAKIETPQAVAQEREGEYENLNEILDVADGLMIARGDLALQLTREDVPSLQKDIIRLCNKRGKTVITATEMLASMEKNHTPTRAEANDVFNAIIDGTDAVMLSGETAKGKYPYDAVRYMAQIAEKAEMYFEKIWPRGSSLNAQRFAELMRGSGEVIEKTDRRLEETRRNYLRRRDCFARWAAQLYEEKIERSLRQGATDRISHAGCLLAEEKEFKAIVASTASGRTVRMISRFRPSVKIVGATYDEKNRRKMVLCYGSYPINIGKTCSTSSTEFKKTEEVFGEAAVVARKGGLAKEGDPVIFVTGTPLFMPGTVNSIQITDIPK